MHLDPPAVRCGRCGGRCRWYGNVSIYCDRCRFQNADARRAGWFWRLRVWIGR